MGGVDVRMKVFGRLGFVRVVKVSQELRCKSIELISLEFPCIFSDVQRFAKEHQLDEGDVAVKVVAEIIYPMLVEGVVE